MKTLSANLIGSKNALSTSAWLWLLEITLTDSTIVRIVNNTEDVVLEGNTYTRFAFEVEGTKSSSKGEIPTISLKINNTLRVFQSYIESLSGAVGSSVRVILADSANLADGAADEVTYDILGTTADSQYVTFTLGAPYLTRRRFPLYRYIADHCMWVSRFRGRECFTPNQQIIGENKINSIQDLKINDIILSSNGHFGIVNNILKKKYYGDIIKFRPSYLPYDIETTPDHLIYGIRQENLLCNNAKKRLDRPFNKCHVPNIINHKSCRNCGIDFKDGEFIKSKELKKNDFIKVQFSRDIQDMEYLSISKILRKRNAIYMENKIDDKIRYFRKYKIGDEFWVNDKLYLNDDILRLFGYYLAEGSTGKNLISFGFNENETEYINDVVETFKKYFGINPILRQHKSKCIEIRVRSELIKQLFSYIGNNDGSYRKKICEELMLLPPKKQLNILIGLIRGDGNIRDNTKICSSISFATTSKVLAWQVWTILLRNKILPTLMKSQNENSGVHTISIRGKAGNIFALQVFNKEISYDETKRNDFIIVNDDVYVKIRKLEIEKYDGEVYDLSVSNQDNTYVVGGVAVHNCGYTGILTTCNGTLADCQIRNNSTRFGAQIGLGDGSLRII